MAMTWQEIARAGAAAANSSRSPKQRKDLSRKAAGVLWKGHKKNKKGTCKCKGCKRKHIKK